MGGRGPEGGGGHAGENNCEDYFECADLSNASSCRAFDANNNVLKPAYQPRITAVVHADSTSIQYTAAAGSVARAEVTVFEKSPDKLGPFGHDEPTSSKSSPLKSDDVATVSKLNPALLTALACK